jgi:hypothetical protein
MSADFSEARASARFNAQIDSQWSISIVSFPRLVKRNKFRAAHSALRDFP